MNYKNIRLDKSMYKADGGFSSQLEKLDPSENYKSTELENLDAYERQLKRFGIKVSGENSDLISKFFSTGDSAALFPEYVARSVASGADLENTVEQIIASSSVINSLDYRSITTDITDKEHPEVGEGTAIPKTKIVLSESLVTLKKRGRILCSSYEALKMQRADVLSVALSQVGASLVKAQLSDAVQTLLDNVIADFNAGTALTYGDLVGLWSQFGDFQMNTIIASPKRIKEIMMLQEIIDASAGNSFITSGTLMTPFGAKLIKTDAVPDEFLIAIDRRYALEMVTTGGIQVEYDKLIDTQLERAAITTTYGFSKLFADAVKIVEFS